ncbi:MAG: bifunctional methylenetetrahydrofolate dehydrogenase/methenyltetrahydrofolate cyclohydrolase FolD [Saprospiraceae bacterium]|jgi:methylenetetrahydrofolate dehydrogenase (NADP+)/methenyltetrahydrofolate cyclohydrolase|nr:bifunctional methylenetetrahydrofolate dehydrogenase/methenyltetrahydrofolate cyclohydrolase FolD [Saprospiraceae bacterium]MBP9210028.1 bifunctional methylenetetrahydrofolate dehydrogenase/methenyltetrahydrofolate cyclohydrolase FolD [Saprospiraceae bacterium]MBV6472875.1 Bifunctional protein FolD protein [Saprospiraceae bacterium]
MLLLDGNKLSALIRKEIQDKVRLFCQNDVRPPHLAAVLIGDNPASQTYVRNKIRACDEVGFASTLIKKPASTTQEELLHVIDNLNRNPEIDGYIVQLPLPRHIDEHAVNLAIDPAKDVDGFHPFNFGKMALGLPSLLPATPMGIMMMLERYHIETEGKHCVVLGRSNIVGTPVALLLSKKAKPGNATVTIAHSKTCNLAGLCRQADIIVAALGIPRFLKADMVREGAVVIDVGINRIDDPTTNRGFRLVGDVDFEEVSQKVSAISPVPGGVGPMTITALVENTWRAFSKKS